MCIIAHKIAVVRFARAPKADLMTPYSYMGNRQQRKDLK